MSPRTLPRESRRDPGVGCTRQVLQNAQSELMAERSFGSITVRKMAERATVNRVTFCARFPDRPALLQHPIRNPSADRSGARPRCGPAAAGRAIAALSPAHFLSQRPILQHVHAGPPESFRQPRI